MCLWFVSDSNVKTMHSAMIVSEGTVACILHLINDETLDNEGCRVMWNGVLGSTI